MIIVLKKNYDYKDVKKIIDKISAYGLTAEVVIGESSDVINVIGDTYKFDVESLRAFPAVEAVKRLTLPYHLVNNNFVFDDTNFCFNDLSIEKGDFCFIAGPCSVESETQIVTLAEKLKDIGVTALRGGAFKPRTSPYSFQGLGNEGIRLLLKAKAETGLKIVSEITDVRQLVLFTNVDMLQIGARNMQNFELLKEVAQTDKPILLKRGLASTIEEWLLAAEYLMSYGNGKVILCERGVRSFDPSSRSILDLSSIPTLKELTSLPVIVDPSHASGNARHVKPLALAAAAVGADGVMIEVHDDPVNAFSDGAQAVTTDEFKDIHDAAIRIFKATKSLN